MADGMGADGFGTTQPRTQAYVEKSKAELEDLAKDGLTMAGNTFSPVLFLKAQAPGGDEGLLAGTDGDALRASLRALGYQPQDWVALSTVVDGGGAIAPSLLRRAIGALDPQTVIACDEPSAQALRETYVEELTEVRDLSEAMLDEGVVAVVLGMRFLNLGDFAAALADPKQKQVMWARLKQVPPQGEPY